MKTVALLNYLISARGLSEDAALAFSFAKSAKTGQFVACANPHSLFVAARDGQFAGALRNADILLPDGAGIVFAAKVLHLPLHARVAGYEFFITLTALAEGDGGLKYFFLGSRNDVLKRICERMSVEYPSIDVCGTYSPPYKEEFDEHDNEAMIDFINNAKPDVLWVGMTAPKQEKWIFQNKDRLKVPFIGAIGAVFDFYAGTVKRPFPLWQKFGLEWLGRFLQEPRRLWRRNVISTPVFLYWILKEKLHQMFGEKSAC
jgi:N-acetylglucosaminyldiphosphoundecaprenol N-acetyl-beta-D-mannosaminyltransferase